MNVEMYHRESVCREQGELISQKWCDVHGCTSHATHGRTRSLTGPVELFFCDDHDEAIARGEHQFLWGGNN